MEFKKIRFSILLRHIPYTPQSGFLLDFATIVPQLRIKDLIFVSTFANNLRNHSTDNTIFSLGILSIKGIWMRLLRYIIGIFQSFIRVFVSVKVDKFYK